MVLSLSVSTCSFGFYGPLLLAALHDYTPLSIELIICSKSVTWSILSILVANASREAFRAADHDWRRADDYSAA